MRSFDSFNHPSRLERHPRAMIRMVAAFMMVLSMLPLQHLLLSGTAQAATCAAGGVVITDNISATSSAGSLTFYEDTGINPPLRGMYVGYTITNNAATTSADLWVKLDTFSQTRIALGANEDGIQHIGPLAAGASKQVYFYLADASGSTDANSLNETFQVNIYSGDPSLTSETCDYTDTINSIDDNIQASANKINTSVSGPNPAMLGGIMTMTIVGETGTIGSAQQFGFTPATYTTWPANAYQLADTHVDFWQGTTCPDSTGGTPAAAPGNTYDHVLVFTTPNTTNSCYKVVYTFVATGATSAPTTVSPINNISSGTQVKHTSNYAVLPAVLQPVVNTTKLSKSVSPTNFLTGGTASYTVTINNTGSIAVTLDKFKDTLPSNASYVTGSSHYNGSLIGDPTPSGQTLNWAGLFTVAANSSSTLTYQATIPNTPGTYTNSVVGMIGSTQIDTTIASTTDNSPATATASVGSADLSLTKTDTPDPVSVGGTLTYQLNVTNNGSIAASSVTVTDALPGSVAFVSASGTGWACSQASGTVTCTRASLAVGAAPTISVVVSAPAGAGSLTNTASVSSATTDQNMANNSASATTTVQIVPGAVAGTVFNDLNGDGVQNGAEGALNGVTVELLNSSGTVVATTTTSGGAYSFSSVTPGSYTVRETDPSGYTSTTANSVPVSVVASATASANFGDQQQGTISGTIYDDPNGNGAQDSGETGLSGVTVELLNSSGTLVASTTTSGGAYSFSSVTPGSYTVRETDPSGYTSTTANSVPVNLAAGGAAHANFGDQQVGAVSGMVFNDLNGNGLRDGAESGIGSVTVQLVNGAGTVVATTTTAGTGSYSFTGVAAGQYTVRETDPSGYTSTTANSVPVNIAAGGSGTANFGDQQTGTISGSVWSDLNGDGTQGAAESGLGGVTLQLLDGAGTVVALTTSAADGTYSFTGVAAGSYTVRESDPAGYISTTANAVPVNLAAGGAANANFGDQQTGTISGSVWSDLNGDGTQDAGESGLGGTTVELVNSSGTVVATAITAGNGSYTFIGVVAGSYTVRETDPSGYTSTTANSVPVNVAAGGAANANFGDQQQGTISGSVWSDLNGDGTQGTGESGLGGVALQLLDSGGALIATTTTAGDGSYIFTGVTAGSYTVNETDPSGYTSTTANTVPLSIAAGGAGNANFGDQQQGTISGGVFSDLNGNGLLGSGEDGLGGVTIQLINSGGTVVATTTTAGNGSYLFSGVTPGVYTVRETDPSGYASTTANSVLVSIVAGGSGMASFGDQQQGTVSGGVFSDLNGDYTQNTGEGGLGGVTIELLDSTSTVVATTTTAGNGSYTFTGVVAGSYTVRETDPSGYTSTTANSVPVNVAAGGAANANFGDQQQGTVSGSVFSDLNGDGVLSGAENGLGGVTIELLDSTGTVVATTTTAGNGSYTFTGVVAGSYTVRETDPSGYTSTTANSAAVSVGAGSAANANFGDQQQGNISGTVYSDLNGDSTQDAGESGLGGVAIELLDSTSTVVATTTTVGNGSYLFSGVAVGSYTVRETDPSGYASTTPNTVLVTVAAGGAASANFGDQQQSTVVGKVFSDLDGSGTQNGSEGGLGGVTIELLNGSTVVATTTTLADGSYSFSGVLAGSYTVRETDPSGYTSTTANTVALNVSAGGSGTANFGDQQQGTVSGSVFSDLNGDGTQGSGEGGLGGVTVELLNSSGTVIATTTTAGDGSYTFTGVTPGSYTVRATSPSGYVSTTPSTVAVTIGAGGATSANFGNQQQGTVSGVVFSDLNANGVQGSGEGGIGGVALQLLNSLGTVVATTTTAGDGSYLFGNVPAGSYTVTESDPAGLTSTTPNSVSITIVGNGSASANFGDRQVGTVAGLIFLDTNGNGVQDPGETGIAGVQLIITDSQGLSQTVTTDANGNYTAVMLVGNATLSVVASSLPPNMAPTTSNQQQTFVVGNGITAIAGNVGYNIAPTAVALVSFSSAWQNGALVVRWVTAAEINTWGFYLYRSATGSRADAVRVTPSVILGKGHNQGGGSYEWTDAGAMAGQAYTYWLQEVELNGSTHEYGPATTGTASSSHTLYLPLAMR